MFLTLPQGASTIASQSHIHSGELLAVPAPSAEAYWEALKSSSCSLPVPSTPGESPVLDLSITPPRINRQARSQVHTTTPDHTHRPHVSLLNWLPLHQHHGSTYGHVRCSVIKSGAWLCLRWPTCVTHGRRPCVWCAVCVASCVGSGPWTTTGLSAGPCWQGTPHEDYSMQNTILKQGTHGNGPVPIP
jgi:hypothetical protein